MTESNGASPYRWVILLNAFLVHATVMGLIFQSIPPLKTAIAADLGTTWDTAVIIYSAFALGLLVTQIPGGALGDRFSVRLVVGAGTILAGLVTALRFAVPTLWGMVAMSLIATIGMGMANPNLITIITRWFPEHQLGLGQGILFTGVAFGGGLAFSLSGGIVLDTVGTWERVYVLYGGITVLTGIMWLLMVHKPRPDQRPANRRVEMLDGGDEETAIIAGIRDVLLAPSTKWAVILAGLLFWGVSGLTAVLPEFAGKQPYDVPELALGIPLYVTIFGAMILPPLSDRIGRRLGIYVGILGTVSGVAIAIFAPNLYVFLIGIAIAGLAGTGTNAMFYVLPGELTDIADEHVGTMAGVILALGQLGAVVGSVVVAKVLANFGIVEMGVVAAGPILLGLACARGLRLGEREAERSLF